MNRLDHIEEELSDLIRRMRNLIRIGKVVSVEGPHAMVQIDDELTLKTRFLSSNTKSYVSWSPPSQGEQVVVMCPYGELTQAYSIGSFFCAANMPPASDDKKLIVQGEDSIEYDAKTGKLNIKCKSLELNSNQGELFSLLSEAFEIIAKSKTPTLMGPQPSLDCASQLPALISKFKGFAHA